MAWLPVHVIHVGLPGSVLSARFGKGEVVVHVDADDRRFSHRRDRYFEFNIRAGRRDGLCAFIGASVPFATFSRLTDRRTDEPFGFCLRP